MVKPQARNNKHHKHMFVYLPASTEHVYAASKTGDSEMQSLMNVGNGLVTD